jgi:hypothetical protein
MKPISFGFNGSFAVTPVFARGWFVPASSRRDAIGIGGDGHLAFGNLT